MGGNMETKMVEINAYADDVVIISRNPKALEEALQEIHNTAKEIGLIIKKERKKLKKKKKK
jgi:predicted  nucleic acid-binding Zn-ribbon protein